MKIAVIGTGHMGLWLVKEMSRKHELCVYDLDPSRIKKLSRVVKLRNFKEIADFEPDILINAVDIKSTLDAFRSALPYLPKKCILADMASVKDKLPDFYASIDFRYVSVHTMFGPTFANVEDLKKENVVIIRESDKDGATFFEKFFRELHLNIFYYTFEEHDRMIAYSLTLPFASTMVFAGCMDKSAVPGTTFKRHLQIARGLLSEDDRLLSEILFNRFSLFQLEKVTSQMEFLKHVIREKDQVEAVKLFNRLRRNISG